MAKELWIVYQEWQNDEPYILAVFTGTTAERRALRHAEEVRHAFATGTSDLGPRCYSVWAHEGNEDPEWEIDIHVEQVPREGLNPPIPQTYRRLVRARERKAVHG